MQVGERTFDRRRVLLGAAVVGAVLLGGGWLLRPTDEEAAIRAVLARLCAALHVDPKEGGPVQRFARVHGELGEVLTKDVILDLPDFPEVRGGRREVSDLASQAGAAFTEATVALSDVTIRMAESKKSAQVEATAVLDGVRGSERRKETRKVQLRLDKIDGAWRVATVGVSARAPE